MKKTIVLLALTALILFGGSNALSGIALERAQEARLELMQTILPGSEAFEEKSYDGTDGNIQGVYQAETGYVLDVSSYGYAGDVNLLVGVNTQGRVTGLVVLQAHETWGLGNRALTDHVFLSQFLNQSGSFAVGTQGQADAFSGATGSVSESDGNEVEVDALTGATVTSKAVVRCVNSAVGYVTGVDASSSATTWGG